MEMKKEFNVNFLLVDNDANQASNLKSFLEEKGFAAKHAANGEDGLREFMTGDYNFCITDVSMPVKDGFSMVKEIRKKDTKIPILFLSSKQMEEDRLRGFQLGGDDYLTKPFNIEELMLRINAIYRRVSGLGLDCNSNIYHVGSLIFDYAKQKLLYAANETKLTSKESELLLVLIQNKNQLIKRSYILNRIWQDDTYCNARCMDVYISKIRKMLKSDPELEVVNVHGVGFKLLTQKKKAPIFKSNRFGKAEKANKTDEIDK